jgi:acyl dehydratase
MSAQPSPLSLTFVTLPSMWSALPKLFLARRPALLAEGRTVPRIEARIDKATANAGNLRDYRRICGCAEDGRLPLVYPHLMAMPLHMAMLTSDAFPVRLLGLVHVRNEIRSHARIGEGEALEITCTLDGHRETDRGQEFDLLTECRHGGRSAWNETSTFLARRRSARGSEKPRGSAPSAPAATPTAVRTTSFHADADIGRRYAAVSGDFNPIHLSDLSARLFGFDRAIAHGLWSLSRTVAELDTDTTADTVRIDAAFKLPVFLPAWLTLQTWTSGAATAFALKDAQGEKPHMTGGFGPL